MIALDGMGFDQSLEITFSYYYDYIIIFYNGNVKLYNRDT